MNDQEYLSGVWQKVDEKEMANQIVEYMDTLPKKIGPREFAACLFNHEPFQKYPRCHVYFLRCHISLNVWQHTICTGAG